MNRHMAIHGCTFPLLVRVALALLLVCTAQSAFAQTERRGFIGLGIGPSTPFGSFAEASAIEPGTGRATTGYTDTFVNFGYRIGKRLGVSAAASYSEFLLRGGGDDDWWQVAGLAVGPMYSVRLSARSAVDLKAMVAFIALTPIVDSYTTIEHSVGSVGVDMRAAVRYDVLRRWAVFAEGGVQMSSVSFQAGRKDFGALITGFGVAFRPTW